MEEKNYAKRKLLDILSSLAYFMVLSGEVVGDWVKEAHECYEIAISECENGISGINKIPIPFNRIHKSYNELFEDRPKKKRRESF